MMNLFQLQEQLKDFSKDRLVKEMQSPSGTAPPYLVMTELQRRARMESAAALDKGTPTTTVAQDTVNAAGVPQGGIADMARALAPQTDMAQNTGAQGQMGAATPQPVQTMQEGGLAGVSRSLEDYGILSDPAVRVMAERQNMTPSDYVKSLHPEALAQTRRRIARSQMMANEPKGDGFTFPTQEDLDMRAAQSPVTDEMLIEPGISIGGVNPSYAESDALDRFPTLYREPVVNSTMSRGIAGLLAPTDTGPSNVSVPQRLQTGQRGGGSSDYTPRPEYADPEALGLAGDEIARMREVERAREIAANRGPRVSAMATPEESLLASLTADPIQNVPIDVRDGSYIPPRIGATELNLPGMRQALSVPSQAAPAKSSEFSKAKALEGKQTEDERRQLERQARTFGTDVESLTAGVLGETPQPYPEFDYIPPRIGATELNLPGMRQALSVPSQAAPAKSSEFSKAKALEGKQTEDERRQLERQARTFGTDVESLTAGVLGETPQPYPEFDYIPYPELDLFGMQQARDDAANPDVFDPRRPEHIYGSAADVKQRKGPVEGETTAEMLSRLGGPIRQIPGLVGSAADKYVLGPAISIPQSVMAGGSAAVGAGASALGFPEVGQQYFDLAGSWQEDAARLANEGYFGANTTQPENLEDLVPGDTTTALPGDTTTALPGDTTTALPGDTTTALPGDTTTALPGDTTTALPGDTTTALPGGAGGGLPAVPSVAPMNDQDRMLQQDKWLALARFGAALASSRAPTFGQAIGEAGQVGLDALGKARQDYLERKAAAEMMALKRAAMASKGGRGGGGGGGGDVGFGLSASEGRALTALDGQVDRAVNKLYAAQAAVDENTSWRSSPSDDQLKALSAAERDLGNLVAQRNAIINYGAGIQNVSANPSENTVEHNVSDKN